jgi:hypothetical protein
MVFPVIYPVGRAIKTMPFARIVSVGATSRTRKLGTLPINNKLYLCPDNRHLLPACRAFTGRPSRPPIKALHLIGEHDAGWRPRQGHFERIPLDLCRHRATNHQPDPAIVSRGAEHDGRLVSGLLVLGLRVEVEPDNIASIRHKPAPDQLETPNQLEKFLADRRVEVDFFVDILIGGRREQVHEAECRFQDRLYDHAAAFVADVHGLVER